MIPAAVKRRSPWLDDLTDDADAAVDALLQGVAYLPGLQRASPCEALVTVMAAVPPGAPEWDLLDTALRRWLQARRRGGEAVVQKDGGAEHFISKVEEGFRCAWTLELPQTSAWIRAEFSDLLRWADGYTLNATFDLGTAVLAAGAHLQQGMEFYHIWLAVCRRAGQEHRRLGHRLTLALLGLARRPGMRDQDLVVGLAHWASHLPRAEQNKRVVVQEWRAIKAARPRQPAFWRGQWEALLRDRQQDPHPYIDWLKEGDPILKAPFEKKAPRKAPEIPKNIPRLIEDMGQRCRDSDSGLTTNLRMEMDGLLNRLERYAEVTGETYYLVTSCTNIATIVLDRNPDYALTLVRRALLWAPSDGHAWSLRASALDRLERPDLAWAVRWEGMRRIPSNLAFCVDQARALMDQDRVAEAEALLRRATLLNPRHEPSHVEQARALWLLGRAEEAIGVLRAYTGRQPRDATALYTLGQMLIAEGQFTDAGEVRDTYARRFGEDQWVEILSRRLSQGPDGQAEERQHLRTTQHRAASRPSGPPPQFESQAEEERETRVLGRVARVAEADLLLGMGAVDKGVALVDAALAEDDSDAYAHVVKALAVPGHRAALVGRSGRFAGSLPVQLALLDDGTPDQRWEGLRRDFPDGTPLIDLVRWSHGRQTLDALSRLDAWAATESRWDEGWARYVKTQVRRHLDEAEDGPPPPPLSTLAHGGLVQAVDVGFLITAPTAVPPASGG